MRRMARGAEDFELGPTIVLVDDVIPTLAFEKWLELLDEDEPVDLDLPAAELLAEARDHGEV